jgi:hypothetical protein
MSETIVSAGKDRNLWTKTSNRFAEPSSFSEACRPSSTIAVCRLELDPKEAGQRNSGSTQLKVSDCADGHFLAVIKRNSSLLF